MVVTGGPLFFLGIDGGGSGCRARLIDGTGTVLAQVASGPASLRLGADAAWAALMSAAAEALGSAGIDSPDTAVHAAIGVAGVGRKKDRELLASKPHVFASLTIVSDAAIACLGAHGGLDGGIVIAGTGSIGLGYVDGREVRVGGYGFPISDAGSGADLGLEALRMALQAHDGFVATSPFISDMMRRFDDDPFEVVAWMDRATAEDYAALTPTIARHAASGDANACTLMQAAATEIAHLAGSLLARGVPRLALMGSVAPLLLPWLPDQLRTNLQTAEGDAMAGALALARRAATASGVLPV